MPELPDIDLYVEALAARVSGHTLSEIRLASPFLLRSVDPAPNEFVGHAVTSTRRIGKRVVIGVDRNLWLVLHLMIAGRLHWQATRPALKGKNRLAAFDFDNGSLLLTESGSKKRASLYLARGDAELATHDPGGLEPLCCSFEAFDARLREHNHTMKRALTSPAILSGIGNAYSDEILHRARLSPVRLSQKLSDTEMRSLFDATVAVLTEWSQRVREEANGEFPGRVTAFRSGMAVHGRFGKPCPECNQPIQRIRYKSNETNYCAQCQNGGRLLADRSLSRLLKKDWPRTLDDL